MSRLISMAGIFSAASSWSLRRHQTGDWQSPVLALEAATTRITALLDDVEAPVRSLASQIGAMPPDSLPRAVENLNLLSTNLSQLVAPLTGVAGLAGSFLGGLRSPAASAALAEPPAEPAPAPAPPAVRSRRKAATRSPKGA